MTSHSMPRALSCGATASCEKTLASLFAQIVSPATGAASGQIADSGSPALLKADEPSGIIGWNGRGGTPGPSR